jgi:NitT/TauT family transport system permease protein
MDRNNNEKFGLLCIVLMWYLLHFLVNPVIIPSPHETTINLVEVFQKDYMLKHILYSIYRLITAIGLAVVTGVLLGVLIGLNEKAAKIILPSVYIMFPIPKAAFLPVIFLVFGLGDISKIFLIFIILVFQIIISTRDSVKNLQGELFISAKSLNMSFGDILRHIVFPGILPGLISSLRLTIGIGIAVLFFSETYATKFGIGYYIMDKWSLIEYVDMYSGIMMLSLMGYGLFKLTNVLEDNLCGWTKRG